MIFESDTILNALNRLISNSRRVLFVVDDRGQLKGSVTDGDFRRWVTENPAFDLGQKVSKITNKNCISANIDDKDSEIEKKFTSSIDVIPLQDNSFRLVGVAVCSERKMPFRIGERSISENSKSFIIAEIGNNHNGDVTLAEKLVDLAHEAGADCIKFQMREIKTLYKSADGKDNANDLGSEYTLDLLKKFQLSNDELFRVFDYCKNERFDSFMYAMGFGESC